MFNPTVDDACPSGWYKEGPALCSLLPPEGYGPVIIQYLGYVQMAHKWTYWYCADDGNTYQKSVTNMIAGDKDLGQIYQLHCVKAL
jgi:hypothetical protein